MKRAAFSAAILLIFSLVPAVRAGAADGGRSPACAPRVQDATSPAAVFDPEEADDPPPAEPSDAHDDSDSIGPRDQSWNPFEVDDDDEMQA